MKTIIQKLAETHSSLTKNYIKEGLNDIDYCKISDLILESMKVINNIKRERR